MSLQRWESEFSVAHEGDHSKLGVPIPEFGINILQLAVK